MTEIIYRKDVEDVVKTEIDKFLRPFVWLIPTWCHRLIINVEITNNASHAIRTSATPEYRFANMSFSSTWLICDSSEKQIHVIHDLLHTANCPYVDFSEEVIHNYTREEGQDPLRGHLMEQSRKLLEGMTQDLAKSIYDKFRKDDPLTWIDSPINTGL